MHLDNEFTLPVDIETAWNALLDVPRIAPCFPGATVRSVEGNDISGHARVKLGPVVLTYEGVARFVERVDADHRVVIEGSGTDRKGNGTAGARIVAQLHADSSQVTRCRISTDLTITGRPAQFGRGLMVDVSNKIIGQFADNLSRALTEPPATSAPTGTTSSSTSIDRPVIEAEPLDMLAVGKSLAVERSVPIIALALGIIVIVIVISRRRRRS